MKARETPLGYQEDCQLKEVAVDQEGTGAPVFFDYHEVLRGKRKRTREQEYQVLMAQRSLA
jgi:hypothetical protein